MNSRVAFARFTTTDADARRRRTVRRAALLVAATCALLAAGGCGHRDGTRATRPSPASTHSAAMAPGDHLDPPSLASMPAESSAGGVPVLCYHYFRGRFAPGYALRVLGSVLLGLPALGPREFWTTPAAEFERHLQHFRDQRYTSTTLDAVADLVESGRPLPARALILTIDDADRSVYEVAWPLLRKYGMRAHLFVPTSHVGRAWSGLQVCSEAQLEEMAASGAIILDSHTHDLHYKEPFDGKPVPVFLQPQLIPADHRTADDGRFTGRWAPVARDLVASRAAIAALAGPRAPWLAWPYGFANAPLDSLSRSLGFRGTVSLRPRLFGADNRDLLVGRFTLTAHTTLAQIAALTP